MKKLLLLTLLLLGLASASTINFNFDTVTDSSQGNTGIVYSDSIVFQVTTPVSVLCRYSQTKDMSFNSMEGIFEDNFETIHKKTLTRLSNGVYRYYTKCRPIDDLNNQATGTAQLESIFKISNPISAQISLSNIPLKAGKHEITLQTTKIPASTPLLKYSFDGITYNPIILHGSENSWSGFLVVSSSAGEEVGSFKFEARDLEGRSGSQIYGDSTFEVDTRAPSLLTSVEAEGEYGQIELTWFFDENEEITSIKIYKSETPNVDRTNLYKTIDGDKNDYTDTDVENGKTYYYRISSLDAAGNAADLSREIQATGLISKTSSTSSGLASSLIGSVDALLSEIELLEAEIENSNDMINDLNDEEKDQIKVFKITDNFASAKSELSILKRNIESYKSTDITKELLDGKLGSSRVKMNIIKKKIPNTITSIDSSEITFNPTEDSIRKAVLEYSPELTPSTIDKTVKKSLEFLEDNNLKIKSKINILETTYLDGSTSSGSVIEHSLDSELEKSDNAKFLLKFPSGSLDLNSLSIKNLDYSPEQEGLVSFETDTKQILYTLDQKLELGILKEISISPVVILEESTPLTGYFLSNVPTSGSSFATILILVASGLIGYLFFIKQQQKKTVSLEFLGKAHQVKVLQKEGKADEANSLYEKLKIDYLGLSSDQKHEVFKEIKNISKQ